MTTFNTFRDDALRILRSRRRDLMAMGVNHAAIFGSVARRGDRPDSDVDVMIVSNTLGYDEVFGALESATVALGRKVNPTLYTPADWAKRFEQDSAFVTHVWQQPKIWLIGTEEQLHAPSA